MARVAIPAVSRRPGRRTRPKGSALSRRPMRSVGRLRRSGLQHKRIAHQLLVQTNETSQALSPTHAALGCCRRSLYGRRGGFRCAPAKCLRNGVRSLGRSGLGRPGRFGHRPAGGPRPRERLTTPVWRSGDRHGSSRRGRGRASQSRWGLARQAGSPSLRGPALQRRGRRGDSRRELLERGGILSR